jgi:putative transposase
VYPYLLRHTTITRPNHVWAMDITYIPMAHGFSGHEELRSASLFA